mmetsp:Transcript_19477/g.58951  ORF Transcript_19477/g.58951 Transcript_19477/m.58951 type:complete len:282 (-) Transcript_19477:65-910(-)
MRLVHGVRELLALEAHARVARVRGSAVAPPQRPVEVVAGVDLDARLRGAHAHHAAALGRPGRRDGPEAVGARRLAEDVVVIVPFALVRVVDVVSQRLRFRQVHRARAFADLARRDALVVRGRVEVRVYPDDVTQDVGRAAVLQVPVAVVREVQRRRRVRCRRVFYFQRRRRRQRIRDARVDAARVALLPVRRPERERQGRVGRLDDGPAFFVEAHATAVQVVRAVVRFDLVVLSVERERRVGHSIRDAACCAAEVRTRGVSPWPRGRVRRLLVEAQHALAQ